MARNKKSPIQEAARKLAGKKIDNRYTDLVEGHIAAENADLEETAESIGEATRRELGLSKE